MSNKNYKILHLIPYYIRATRTGGPAQQLHKLALSEKLLGHQVAVITTTSNLKENISLPVHNESGWVDEDGIPTYYFERKSFLLPHTFYFSPRLPKFLSSQIHQYDIVIVHGIWTYFDWIGSIICHKYDKPFLIYTHGSLDTWAIKYHGLKKNIYWKFVEKKIFSKSDGIIVLNDNESEELKNFGIQKPIYKIKTGLLFPVPRHDEPDKILDEYLSDHSLQQYILFLGRLHPKKGIDLLIEAWSKIYSNYPEFSLIIAGPDEGNYLSTLESIVHKFHISDKVIFPGLVTGDIKTSLLQRAYIFALTSYSEGIPLAVIEALAYGLPVLITPDCHLPEVMSAKAGLIVEPDVIEIANGLKLLLDDKCLHKEMAENAETLAKKEFDAIKISEGLDIFCESILENINQ